MNKYTVDKVTTGLGHYLLETCTDEECAKRGVAVTYDTGSHSYEFTQLAADVLSGMGIKVYLMKEHGFSVKYLNALTDAVITASHNPKQYNGYEVYNELGCQVVPRYRVCQRHCRLP